MSWDLKPFGELYAIPSRNGLSLPADKRGHGCKMINMGELFAYPTIKNPDMARVQPSENEIEKYAVEKDDLLFARRSLVLEGAGKCAIVAEHERPTVFESSIIRVRLNKEICDPVFYFYFFRSQVGFGFIQQIVNQVAIAGIRGSDLERMKIIYPPLPVQQKIAAILSAYDDLIENNNKRIALLEKASEEIYREWFIRMRFPGWEQVKFAKGVPQGWGKDRLGNICRIKGGKRLPLGHNLTDIKTEHPYIKARDIKNGKIDTENLQYVEDKTFDQIKNYTVKKGDICITIVANIGDVGIVPESLDGASLTENAVKIINLQNNINNLYLLRTLSTKFYKDYMNILSAGAAQSKLGIYKIESIEVLLPPTELQKRFEEIVSSMMKEAEVVENSNSLLKQSRDMLLSRLISGKLSVEALDIRFPPSMIAQ